MSIIMTADADGYVATIDRKTSGNHKKESIRKGMW